MVDGMIIQGSVEPVEVFDEPVTKQCPQCGKPMVIAAGLVQSGDSLKFVGSTETCSCGAVVQLQ
jgi:ssDNA-binding Zn-finger/Zn-ribbon topoisomerase 1